MRVIIFRGLGRETLPIRFFCLMEKIESLKPALKTSSYESTNIGSKIKNIEGKIRMPIHNVTFVQPLNDVTSTKSKPIGECESNEVESDCTPGLNKQNASSMPAKNVNSSFTDVLQHKGVKKVLKIKELRNSELVEGAVVAIPIEVVDEVSSRFVNTFYGYFIGQRLAFPLVENYVKNTWAKFGLKRIQLHEEFFLFQFDTKEGMESVMEHGPWLIRCMPLMLNVWTPNTDLKKDEIKHAPLWVKLHHVLIVAYFEVGLSLISTQLGKPIMTDSYTSNMCLSSWGRSTYARILIEVSADKELMESLVVAIPHSSGKGHSFATVEVEYEWQPPRCTKCLIFDHVTDQCPKNPKVKVVANEKDDGFIEVKRKKNKAKHNVKPRQIDGVRLSKPPINFYYRKVEKGETSRPTAPAETNSKEQQKDDSDQIGRKEQIIKIPIINQDDQTVHVRIWLKLERKELFCSFVYAHNRYIQRRDLWKSLCIHKHYVRDRPWCILGDFNAALFLHDSSAGNFRIDISMREFKECVDEIGRPLRSCQMCVDEIEVMDIQNSRLHFTWSQKPKGKDGLLKKIDHIMVNLSFNDSFIGGHAIFKPYRISDHYPSILNIPTVTKLKPKPFKFYNLITCHERFNQVVMEGWSKQVSGFHMFCVAYKLKNLKMPLRKLRYDKGNLHSNVNQLRDELDQVQTRLNLDPFNEDIRQEEASVLAAFNEACLVEENFLKQKAKIDWLKEGDSNSAYFHKAVKSRVSRSRIDVVTNADGGTQHDSYCFYALFSMGNDKAPGLDGYTVAFFKDAWDIVADDFVAAVSEFFTNGKILKELNHTIIALIPKVSSPTRVNDYRPISCCNVMFKCISKIIANRIKECLKILVSSNQSTFVPGRSIADNILLTQELMHNYHVDRGLPRCAFKVDIQKAYDTVDWDFLSKVLSGFGFHSRMVGWIMECVTTTSFFISINGSLYGFFKSKRGLRQGDPLFPYLFTLIMEILTLMLQRGVRNAPSFTYHRYCSKLELINLCFADDLFLFANGDVDSASVIKNALFKFKEASGLVPSLPKSTAYFCNVLNSTKIAILQILPFEEGRLPVKYLGVPLVSSRLIFRDCKGLIKKVQARVDDWKNKSLSTAGRLQLIRSVIGSMGLGVRRLDLFNKALMVSHIWKLISLKDSLWVKWVHSYKLKGHNFWDMPLRGNMSWGWRKILQLRPFIRNFIWSRIGDGALTSLWFDKWCALGPLSNIISCHDWYRAGLSMSSKVRDVINNGDWSWPVYLLDKYSMLPTITLSNIDDSTPDQLEWRNDLGIRKPFSVDTVWLSIRPRFTKVNWCNIVWFASCIPRYAFNFWLVIKQRLKTQDKVARWDVSDSLLTVCPLCELVSDSHEHLFFECPFSQQIWNHMKSYAGLSSSSPFFSHIMSIISPIANRKSSRSTIAKLVMAASTYFIWQERNGRIFKKSKRR
nr:hypothetical protein [Tanacetum cinerariifolium]